MRVSLREAAALSVRQPNRLACRILRNAFLLGLCVGLPSSRAADSPPGTTPPGAEAQTCAAVANFNLEEAPGGPARITSARLVTVPPKGLERGILTPSGFGSDADKAVGRIRAYCDVTGYVAPQNKFELKLPRRRIGTGTFSFMPVAPFAARCSETPRTSGWPAAMPQPPEMAGTKASGDLTASGPLTRQNYRRISPGAAITW